MLFCVNIGDKTVVKTPLRSILFFQIILPKFVKLLSNLLHVGGKL